MRRKSILGANKQLQLETERVTVRDSASNFNTGSFTRRLSRVVKRGRLIDLSRSRKAQSFNRYVADTIT